MKIYSATFLKQILHMEDCAGEHSRQRKEYVQRPYHMRETPCPENTERVREAQVLGKERKQNLGGLQEMWVVN